MQRCFGHFFEFNPVSLLIACLVSCLVSLTSPTTHAIANDYRIAETIDVDAVPSSFRVGFSLLTDGPDQYVAYYDRTHQMVVASRKRDQSAWQKFKLPTKVGFDSHNYITMAIDRDGHLHVSGNMHCVPLIYFRTSVAGDITTLEKHGMTGRDEDRCTYPIFFTDASGNLLYSYRLGSSGNGKRFLNRYDVATKTWIRFLDTPLFDGQNQRNAYPIKPVKGPDGMFHLAWVWRNTPDCASNNHLSYVRSNDLKNWETADGKTVVLPLTLDQNATWVDPIPAGGGIINGCEKLSFDAHNRPILSYHKRDADGHMQIFVARHQDGAWRSHAITDWKKPVPFSGKGSMPFIGIRIGALQNVEPNAFVISYHHRDYGRGEIVLDETTLKPVDRSVSAPAQLPSELTQRQTANEKFEVRMAHDSGVVDDPNVQYVLRWESLGANRDRQHAPTEPPPSVLRLFKLVK